MGPYSRKVPCCLGPGSDKPGNYVQRVWSSPMPHHPTKSECSCRICQKVKHSWHKQALQCPLKILLQVGSLLTSMICSGKWQAYGGEFNLIPLKVFMFLEKFKKKNKLVILKTGIQSYVNEQTQFTMTSLRSSRHITNYMSPALCSSNSAPIP